MMRTSANKLTVGAKFLALLTLQILCLSLSACGGGGGGGGGGGISPATVTVASGASFPFTVGANQEVVWKVNGVTGGNATDGTIDLTGVYTAPSAPGVVTVTAVSKSSQAVLGTATATIVQFGGYTVGFQNISSMKNARSNHTATLLPTTVSLAVPTGYSLTAGGIGSGGAAIDKAELFNPAARAFGHFTSIGSMTKSRAYHTATRLQNGQVLITGGIDNNNTPHGQRRDI